MRTRLGADVPLTPRQCADYMGFTGNWVREAITLGVTMPGGRVVKLAAETLDVNGRRKYRIHEPDFYDFLRAIGWQHLPSRVNGAPLAGPSPSREGDGA